MMLFGTAGSSFRSIFFAGGCFLLFDLFDDADESRLFLLAGFGENRLPLLVVGEPNTVSLRRFFGMVTFRLERRTVSDVGVVDSEGCAGVCVCVDVVPLAGDSSVERPRARAEAGVVF